MTMVMEQANRRDDGASGKVVAAVAHNPPRTVSVAIERAFGLRPVAVGPLVHRPRIGGEWGAR
jgi:hypothetical protein